mgnify:CR=1 FL=1
MIGGILVLLFTALILQLNLLLLMDLYGRLRIWWIGSKCQSIAHKILRR